MTSLRRSLRRRFRRYDRFHLAVLFTILVVAYVGVPLVVTPSTRFAYLSSLEAYDREGPGALVDFVFQRGLEAMTQAFDILAASALS